MKIINIINEDGTGISDYPINPLLKKWKEQYPKQETCKRFDKYGVTNYSCLNCGSCPEGVDFEVSKEDLEEYKKYLKKIEEYNKIHNPKLAALMELKLKKDNN